MTTLCELAMEFALAAISARDFRHLQAGWLKVDLTRIPIVAMLGLLTSSQQFKEYLPDQPMFIKACMRELERRGESPQRIERLFKGLL